MANTLKTLGDGDITRMALAIFHNKLTFIKTINRQYDDRFATVGAKNGATLLIREPNEYTVRTGATMNVNDITETTQTLTVATQKGIDMPAFTSQEMTMSVDDFQSRFLEPAMSRLAADVEYTVLSNIYFNIFNLTGTPATTPASLVAVRNAHARLSQNLAPLGNRSLLLDSPAMAATLNSMNTYFHKASELQRSFSENLMGHAAGFDWYESNMVPNHTNGARTDSTPIVNTSSGITSGTATITTTGGSGNSLAVGDVFTVGDVYAINRETKQRYSHLQQFAVTTADTDDSGTNVIAVAPTPVTSGAKQNIELVSAGASKAVVHVAAGGSGTASATYAQNLAYHRDAFTFVAADLHMEEGQRMTRHNIEGIPMRLWRGADIVNDKFYCRFDVLFGYKTLRPEWAVRVRG